MKAYSNHLLCHPHPWSGVAKRSTSVEYFKEDIEHCIFIDDEHCFQPIPAMFTCTGSVHQV
jgi:hypothetical protein